MIQLLAAEYLEEAGLIIIAQVNAQGPVALADAQNAASLACGIVLNIRTPENDGDSNPSSAVANDLAGQHLYRVCGDVARDLYGAVGLSTSTTMT